MIAEQITTDDPAEIEKRAEELMEQHLLGSSWHFEWMPRAKRCLGRCSPADGIAPSDITDPWYGYKGEIKLSRKIFVDVGMERIVEEGGPRDLLTDTILHEIAHALEFEERGTSGHGRAWKRHASKVGARPERCAEGFPFAVRKLLAKWERYCPECGAVTGYLHRRPGSNSRDRSCGRCTDSYDPLYALRLRENPHREI